MLIRLIKFEFRRGWFCPCIRNKINHKVQACIGGEITNENNQSALSLGETSRSLLQEKYKATQLVNSRMQRKRGETETQELSITAVN